MKILSVFGTRTEAVKMAPKSHALANDPFWGIEVCVTAQYRRLLNQVLNLFSIQPDFDLELMRADHNHEELTEKVLYVVAGIFDRWRSDCEYPART